MGITGLGDGFLVHSLIQFIGMSMVGLAQCFGSKASSFLDTIRDSM